MASWLASRSGLGFVSLTNAKVSDSISPDIRFIVAFDSFSILSLLFLPVIILTAFFSSSATRISTWFMVAVSMLITSIANVLLLGRQTLAGPPPNVGLCLSQAMLIYAVPVLCSFSAVSFVLQVYLSIHLALKYGSKLSKGSQTWLHVVPCAFFFAVLLEVFIVGLLDLTKVGRDRTGVNCNISQHIPYLITASLVAVTVPIILVLEAMTMIKIRQVWRNSGRDAAFHLAEPASIHVFIRVCVFTLCSIIAMAVSLIQYFPTQEDKTPQLYMISTFSKSLIPFSFVFIFGTQRDMLRVWMFWRRNEPVLYSRASVMID